MKKKKGTQSVVLHRPVAAKKLIVGGLTVLTLSVGLSIAFAKGVFRSPAPDASPKTTDTGGDAVTTASTPRVLANTGLGLEAISRAAADGKYLFAFFWNTDNDHTVAMKKVFDDATARVTDRVMTVSVRVSDPAQSEVVKKYDLARAPMPLVLAIAPNGAITGGFPTKFEEQELLTALATPATEKCMKALQDNKLVFLCVQNDSTTANEEAMRGVQDFQADERYASGTEIVVLDPRDAAEASFLGNLKIDPQTATAVTAFLVPPGSVLAEYQGATTKEQLIAALQRANTSTANNSAVATTSTPLTFDGAGQGVQAMSQAAADNKYLFAFFWNTDNEQTAAMRKVFEDATAKVADRALTVSIRVGDPAESGIVNKYDLARAPMPLVLAIAPNGAVMGGFPTKYEEQELLDAFSSAGTEKCMKALQDGKLVFLCVQNDSTTSNHAALQGVRDYQADERNANAAEIVMLDPRDAAEASFLGNLKIDPQTATAVTAVLMPPASVIAQYQGATTKEQLIAAVQQANTNRGPDGIGPDGSAIK